MPDCDALVSVIMPCRNGAKSIERAIASVLSQSYSRVEIIVVDDGSTDESREIVSKIIERDGRVRLLTNGGGEHGVSIARNIGLKECRGRYISFLDCDDYLLQDSIMKRVEHLRGGEVAVVYAPYWRELPDGRRFRKGVRKAIDYEDMLLNNWIGNLTGMYDRHVIGLVLQKKIKHEDYVMWAEVVKRAGGAYVVGEDELAVYSVSGESLSGNKVKSFFWHWIALRRGLNISIFPAVIYQAIYMISAIGVKYKQIFVVRK